MTTTQRLSASLAIAVLVGGVVALVTAEGQTSATPVAAQGLATATFAGGCFWCMEPPFDKLDGVISTTSGYTGGERRHPTYGDVSSGRTAHAEAVEVVVRHVGRDHLDRATSEAEGHRPKRTATGPVHHPVHAGGEDVVIEAVG